MKTTVKINLNGQIFTLDDDAYQALKDYLDAISKRFRDMEEGAEIISDIESRIAELFQSKVNGKKEVITIEDVNDVITIMGQPEDFLEDDGMESDSKSSYTNRKKSRKYYRDGDNAIFGGVCSGLAAYFGIENWLMRLLWVIFFIATGGGVMFILYIVLWIAVPKAITAAEKLEMRGEKVTVSNIEKTVKEEYETVKENVKEEYEKVRTSKELRKTKNALDEVFHVIGQIVLVVLKIILVIIGFALIISGLAVLTGLSIAVFFRDSILPTEIFGSPFQYFNEIFGILGDPTSMTLISIALFFAIVIPLIAMIYGGIKMMFRFKANDKMIGLTAFVLWIISVVFLVSMAAFEGWNFNTYGRNSTTESLDAFSSDTLVVRMVSDPGIEGFNDDWYFNYDDSWNMISTEDRFFGKIDLDVAAGDYSDYELSVRKNSQGRDRAEASINAAKLDYEWDQEGNILILDPYFSLNKIYKWRTPGTKVTVMVPPGKYIRLDKNTKYFLRNVETVDDIWDRKLAGEVWQMTEDGLVRVLD
jgi:phage shock protein PspC (stress-responsive transcriptional regulator)